MWRHFLVQVVVASVCQKYSVDGFASLIRLAREASGRLTFGYEKRADHATRTALQQVTGQLEFMNQEHLGFLKLDETVSTDTIALQLQAVCSHLTFLEVDQPQEPEPIDEERPLLRLTKSKSEFETWNLQDIKVEVSSGRSCVLRLLQHAWKYTKGRGVRVMILDVGVNSEHVDLKGGVWSNLSEMSGQPSLDDDSNGYVDDLHGIYPLEMNGDVFSAGTHGSHVTGIVGARLNGKGIAGVAPEAELIHCRTKYGRDTLKCAEYAHKLGVRVLNYSMGAKSCCSESYNNLFETLETRDMLFVTSAGNEAKDLDFFPMEPQGIVHPNQITVAALSESGQLYSKSCWSAKRVQLAAPGQTIYSCTAKGWGYASGTSMASPHVAGCLALVFAANPDLTAAGARALLLESVRPVEALKGKVSTEGTLDCGKGRNSFTFDCFAGAAVERAYLSRHPDGTTVPYIAPRCEDFEESCSYWFELGYCKEGSDYFSYMKDVCQRTCHFCESAPPLEICQDEADDCAVLYFNVYEPYFDHFYCNIHEPQKVNCSSQPYNPLDCSDCIYFQYCYDCNNIYCDNI